MPNWGQGLSGAAGGAAAGGAIGGPIGAGVGGVIGGLGGLFGSDPQGDQQRRWEEFYGQQDGVAPQLGPSHQAGYSSFRDNQRNMINRLEAMSRGEGPSVSREMLNEATDRNTRGQMSMAQSGRGNSALAAQNAANNVGMLGAQAGQSAALGRVQEQTNAYNQLGMSLYGARGSDEDMNRFNASGQNRRDEFNATSQMDMYGMNQNRKLAAMNGMQGNRGPGFGDQILAGGGGLASFVNGQRANNQGYRPPLSYPGGY